MSTFRRILFLALLLCLLPAALPAVPKVIVAGEEAQPAVSSQPRVELYVTAGCPYCRQAEAYLKERGVAFVRFEVDKDRAAVKRMKRLTSDQGVPFIHANGRGLTGFSAPAYDQFLEEALGLP